MYCINKQNFLAVALVINRTRDGPATVFHYPPNVQPVISDHRSEPVDINGPEDLLLDRLSLQSKRDVCGSKPLGMHRNHDHHHLGASDLHSVPWEHILGFPTRDLAGILTPARSYHKKLFQLSLDPFLCISYPIHVPDNGRWKKTKKAENAPISTTSRRPEEQTVRPEAESFPPDTRQTEQAKEKETTKREEIDDEKRSSMTMFTLVFILNPKKHEVKDLVDVLYNNVVKKVNKIYKYSQQHSDFIWKESKRILAAKEKAREDSTRMSMLWKELLQTSSLAASVHDIYEAISQNKIATLHLDTTAGVLTPSVQIPAPFYVSDIALEHEQGRHGLWLTTANAVPNQDALEDVGFLDRNFALLLTDDEKKIIDELQADRDPTTVSMIEFARLAKPTMSFYQVGQSNALTLGQIRKYAQHFIFWRRAIAIPPLQARDVYVVSPNCKLAGLPAASQKWQRAFPVAPPLANFLAELSMCPKAYKSFCPSKTHRLLYLRMLAWLLRDGWVTQLCTFGYVVVWPEILYEVDYEMEAEELAAAAEKARAREEADDATSIREKAASPDSTLDRSRHRQQQHHVEAMTSGNGKNPTNAGSDFPEGRTTAEHAAEMARLERIALKAHREAADKAAAHARKVVPVVTRHPSINDAPHLAGIMPYIMLDAKKANGKESRYLSAIAHRLRDDRLRLAWHLICKYLDGRCALERIGLQEDMKPREVWDMLLAMSEYLLCVRHW